MLLTHIAEPGIIDMRTYEVGFKMSDGRNDVHCVVEREVFDDLEARSGAPNQRADNLMASLKKYRAKVEAAASRRFDEGERPPVVVTGDVI